MTIILAIMHCYHHQCHLYCHVIYGFTKHIIYMFPGCYSLNIQYMSGIHLQLMFWYQWLRLCVINIFIQGDSRRFTGTIGSCVFLGSFGTENVNYKIGSD